MKKLLLLCFLLGSASQWIVSQNKVDSLMQQLKSEKETNKKIQLYIDLCRAHIAHDYETSKLYAQRAAALAKEVDNTFGLAQSYSCEGSLYNYYQQYIPAICILEKAIALYGDNQFLEEVGYDNLQLANSYKNIGNYATGLERAFKANDIYKKLNNQNGLRRVSNLLGSLYRYLGNYDKSIYYYSKSLEISELQDYQPGMAAALNNWGLVHKLQGNNELALEYYARSGAIEKMLGDKHGIGIYYNNVGIIHLESNRLDSAFVYFKYALALREETGDEKGKANVYDNLGDYYQKIGNLKKAEEYYIRCIELAKKLHLVRLESVAYKSLTETYEKNENYKAAFSAHKRFKQLSDSLFNYNKALEYMQLEMQHQKKEDLALSELKTQRERFIYFIVIGLFLILFMVFMIMIQKQRSRSIYQKLRAAELEKKQKKINQALERKNKELVSFSMNIAQHHELCLSVINKLETTIGSLKKDNKPIIQNIINEIKSDLNHSSWEEFEVRFLQVHQSFYDNLMSQFPSLSQNEKRLCAFLRLDMSTKEISSITGQTPHTINVARTRLRKKLNLANTDVALNDFLISY
ncbi:tetratricopeptide repeat protein [Carboxylicivirga taeanensis]|uniref:tetratricopeptide repeat protein n=1 Tax=Carboxylicivirga taeanensis TaxID=1416875 RepID=UPI003F6E0A4D